MANPVNQTTLSGTFGTASANPAGLTLKAVYTESVVNAAKGTSTVTVDVVVVNTTGTTERWYRYLDGHIQVRVGGGSATRTQRLTGKQVWFDLKPGKTSKPWRFTFTGVPHASGSVSIGINGAWPQGPAGHNSVGPLSGTLTLNSAPCAPIAPQWPSNGNVMSPGPANTVVLNFINRPNKSLTGATQVSPYTAVTLNVSQSAYPDHFNPISLLSDMGNIAGGSLGLSNYAVQTFWYTSKGVTLPSQVVAVTNVPANHVLTVKPPSNPPGIATGWGVAVSRDEGKPANSANCVIQNAAIGTIQSFQTGRGGRYIPPVLTVKTLPTSVMPLSQTWTSPLAGPSKTGPFPASTSFADTLLWSSNTSTSAPNATGNQSLTYPIIPGYYYSFTLAANNISGGAVTLPQVYSLAGSVPSLSNSTTGDVGEANTVYAPASNVLIGASAYNQHAVSAAITAVSPATVDVSTPAMALNSASDTTLTNYCGDPRQYWPSNTTGNNTASPFVTEVNTAGYTAHNNQPLPQQMTYAMMALGLASVDRAAQFSFVAANNNTGALVSPYIYLGGNPDTPNTAASFPVPAGATSMQLSALVWANSSNVANNRTVTPFQSLRFNALYANGVSVAGENTVNLGAIPVNTLTQLSANYAIPAGAASVVAAFASTTASAANWSGGLQAGDTVSATAFLLGFNQQPTLPFFDGGFPPKYANLANTATSAIQPTSYPYAGCSTQWVNGAGYGGPSQLNAPTLSQYAVPAGDTPVIWSDFSAGSLGNLTMMPFDSNAIAAVAGDPNLLNYGLRTNLILDPSFEYDTVGSAPASSWGSANLTTFAVQNGWAANGTKSCRCTTPTLTSGQYSEAFQGVGATAVAPVGTSYTFQATVNLLSVSGTVAVYALLQWYSAVGGFIGQNFGTFTITPGVSTVSVTAAMPAGAVYAAPVVIAYNYAATSGSADFYIDDVILVNGSQSATPYFDGDQPQCSWAGVPGHSVSVTTPLTTMASLLPNQTYTVSCSVSCPGWSTAMGNLARYRLVTAAYNGVVSILESTPVTANGAMSWTFTVPAGATSAYLAVEALTANPEDVVRFSKPAIYVIPSTNSLGILGTANAVPIRVAQIAMPTYYRQNGWPTPAAYLMRNGGTLAFTSSASLASMQPSQADPRSVTTAADLRFLAAYNYTGPSQSVAGSTGVWSPWYSSGAHAMTFSANSVAGIAPYSASATEDSAFFYQLSQTQNVSLPALQFDADLGTYLFSDDLNAAGVAQYTVILVLSLQNAYTSTPGIWSNVPKAAGGGPDTTADPTTINYVAMDAAGPALAVSALGMNQQTFKVGNGALNHRPSYLALSVSKTAVTAYFADAPSSVRMQQMALTGVSGNVQGSMVLGADALNGLSGGSFYLFEAGIYFSALTAQQVQREIQLLGAIYG